MGPDAMIFIFWMLSFKPAFSLSYFTFIKRLFSSSSLCYQGGVICISEVIDISPSSLDSRLCFILPAFLMMYFAYKLNKQGDNIQPWCIPFPIWKQSVVPCPVLFLPDLHTGFSRGKQLLIATKNNNKNKIKMGLIKKNKELLMRVKEKSEILTWNSKH